MKVVLGIETSCDETAVGVVREDGHILGQALLSQIDRHIDYGGVVPEVAARAHVETIDIALSKAMNPAAISYRELDAVAATCGPGLIGGVLVGAAAGKAIAAILDKPFLGINHLEGHALSPRLGAECRFPYLLLLVSGGHSEILMVEDVGRYRLLGRTLDDAAGEAFDKAARLLGLGYPGGAAIEIAAQEGDGQRFSFPRPLVGRAGCDFSFSGLKTALARTVAAIKEPMSPSMRADLAASFQAAVVDCLADRVHQACSFCRQSALIPPGDRLRVVAAGGVAANQAIRHRIKSLVATHEGCLIVPPPALCTDNGVMIAWAAMERLGSSPRFPGPGEGLAFPVRPRWPLESLEPDLI